jgi:hypothetical protein
MVDDETGKVLAAWEQAASRLMNEVRAVHERVALDRAVRRPAEPENPPENPEEYRRLYRAREIQGYIAGYREDSRRSKWWGDALQNVVIVGSVVVTLTTGAVGFTGQLSQLRWLAMASSGLVAIAAGVSGYYKFRERAANAHRAADAIEYEFKAAALGIRKYRGRSPDEVLEILVEEVERLREEQRQREQQLEQRPEPRRDENPVV